MKLLGPVSRHSKLRHTALLATLALCCAVTAGAQIVSFNFGGTIQQVNDPNSVLPVDITIGLPFSGTVTYDASAVLDILPGDTSNAIYAFQGASANHFSMTVNLGSHTITVNPAPSLPNYVQVFLGIYDLLDYGAREALLDGANPPGDLVDWGAHVYLQDSTATVLSSEALPTSRPELSDFNNPEFYFDASNGPDTYYFGGDLTSITDVPEPATTGAIIAVGLAGFALWRASGTRAMSKWRQRGAKRRLTARFESLQDFDSSIIINLRLGIVRCLVARRNRTDWTERSRDRWTGGHTGRVAC